MYNLTLTRTLTQDEVYQSGFSHGELLVGEHKGSKVSEAKPIIQSFLAKSAQAVIYSEPEGMVWYGVVWCGVSRNYA